MSLQTAPPIPPTVTTPPPATSTFLTTRWHGLAMLNYEVEPRLLEPLVPRGTQLDFFAGKTYVSLVGFTYHDTRLCGWSIPWHRHFVEVNLRYYVRREVEGETRRAVAFIREVVPRPAVSFVARVCYNEAFITAPMRHSWDRLQLGVHTADGQSPSVHYQWRHRSHWLGVGVACEGESAALAAGSHEEFIAEHYWGYSRQRDGGTLEYRVEHPAWRVWTAASPVITGPVADFYSPPIADVLRRPPTSAFLADGSQVRVYRPTRVA